MDCQRKIRFLHISAVVLVFVASIQASPCHQTADIIFAVDTSSSIWPPYFNVNIKNFIKNVISHFKVGPGENDSRIGLIQFSTRVYAEFFLNRYTSFDQIEKHIDRKMRYHGGNTNTDLALKYITNIMLKKKFGSRSNVSTLVIILTDGESDYPSKTKVATDLLKQKNVDIFAIGVGSRTKKEELKYMASDPTENFVFRVKGFAAINSIENRIVNQTCLALLAAAAATTTTSTTTTTTTPMITSTTTTTTTTPPTSTRQPTMSTTSIPSITLTTTQPTTTFPTTHTSTAKESIATITPASPKIILTSTTKPKPITEESLQGDKPDNLQACRGKPADIYFLLDVSSSVWVRHFRHQVLPFVRNIVSSFHISPLSTRVGLVTYSDQVKHIFDLHQHTNLKDLIKALQPENVPYLTGGTNTADAISFATKQGFGNGVSKKNVAKIVITVTDGRSENRLQTTKAAEEARSRGIMLFAVGVGKDVDSKELSSIASYPEDKFIFTVDSFLSLSSITDKLTTHACQAIADKETVSKHRHQIECLSNPLHVTFIHEYMNSIDNSYVLLNNVISTFAIEASIFIPQTKMRVISQPCIGGESQTSSVGAFQKGLPEIQSLYFVTMADLLRKVRLETSSNENYKNERKVVVLIIDENTENLLSLSKEARRLQFKDVHLMVLAIGDINNRLLEPISSFPFKANIIRVDSYNSLKNADLRLLDRMCSSQDDMFENIGNDLPFKQDEIVFNGMPQ